MQVKSIILAIGTLSSFVAAFPADANVVELEANYAAGVENTAANWCDFSENAWWSRQCFRRECWRYRR
jgi:hypothetical protein